MSKKKLYLLLLKGGLQQKMIRREASKRTVSNYNRVMRVMRVFSYFFGNITPENYLLNLNVTPSCGILVSYFSICFEILNTSGAFTYLTLMLHILRINTSKETNETLTGSLHCSSLCVCPFSQGQAQVSS